MFVAIESFFCSDCGGNIMRPFARATCCNAKCSSRTDQKVRFCRNCFLRRAQIMNESGDDIEKKENVCFFSFHTILDEQHQQKQKGEKDEGEEGEKERVEEWQETNVDETNQNNYLQGVEFIRVQWNAKERIISIYCGNCVEKVLAMIRRADLRFHVGHAQFSWLERALMLREVGDTAANAFFSQMKHTQSVCVGNRVAIE